MAPLPFFRLPSSKLHPFEYTAVDVASPFSVTEIKVVHKRWLLVLRCATLGAVHLEMIGSMHTLSFLMAMERFLAVHPRPAVLLADNGTNFHGGETALKGKDQISMSHAQRKLNIKFEFAPPKTPHFQGLMKRIVGAAKAAIKPALRTRVVTGEKLRTIFAKAMGILNNFPISYTVKSGMDFYYRPLTPNHFLLEGIIAKPKLGALPFPLIIIFKDDNVLHVTFVKSLQITKCKEISSLEQPYAELQGTEAGSVAAVKKYKKVAEILRVFWKKIIAELSTT
jgi:hypothetical protein